MRDNEYRTCYVVNFWLGDRRRTTENVKNDKLYLLKKQIEILQTVKHNLNKIILNFNTLLITKSLDCIHSSLNNERHFNLTIF